MGDGDKARRFRSDPLRLAAVAATVVGLAPLAAVMVSLVTARVTGCAVNEGSAKQCMVAGIDISHAIYAGFMMGWLFMLTLPVAAIAVLLWIVVAMRGSRQRHDRRRAGRRGGA